VSGPQDRAVGPDDDGVRTALAQPVVQDRAGGGGDAHSPALPDDGLVCGGEGRRRDEGEPARGELVEAATVLDDGVGAQPPGEGAAEAWPGDEAGAAQAKGPVPETHPLGAGVLGRSGTPVASWLMNEADLLVAVGASFSNHTGIAAHKPILQIDDDPAAIGRFDAVRTSLLGDAQLALQALTAELTRTKADDQRADVAARWAIWRAEKARRVADDRGHGVSAAAVFDALSRHLPTDAVVAVDVGNHAYSLGRYLESKGQPVLMSGYLGSIGFGYPAALGAWAAAPDRPIVAVTGDGGFGQYATELTTAVKYGIPVKHLLLNNNALGKISKEQLAGDYPVWQTSLVNPDWAAYAELCGATESASPNATSSTKPWRRSSPPKARPCSASSKTRNCSEGSDLRTSPAGCGESGHCTVNCQSRTMAISWTAGITVKSSRSAAAPMCRNAPSLPGNQIISTDSPAANSTATSPTHQESPPIAARNDDSPSASGSSSPRYSAVRERPSPAAVATNCRSRRFSSVPAAFGHCTVSDANVAGTLVRVTNSGAPSANSPGSSRKTITSAGSLIFPPDPEHPRTNQPASAG
jgi:hypothetical protein